MRKSGGLLALATAGVGLAAVLMVAPPVILLPVVGVLLTAIAPPSSGSSARDQPDHRGLPRSGRPGAMRKKVMAGGRSSMTTT